MINNYSYNINTAIPHQDLTFSQKVGSNKYNYKEIYSKSGLTEQTAKTDSRVVKKSQVASIFSMSMGQNHHFKLMIPALMVDTSMKNNTYGEFLPVKSITYQPVSIESTKINAGIFADFPIIHKRKLGSIKITLLDNVNNDYEWVVTDWFNTCHDTATGYVKPMGEIIQEARYKEFTNDGKLSKDYYFEVIPDGDVSLNRSYENASLKEISFSVLIVSPIYSVYQEGYSLSTSAKIKLNY